MSRSYRDAPQHERKDEAERDAQLEDRYTRPPEFGCGPQCCASILAFVATHQNALITAYMHWCRTNHVQDAGAGGELASWEEQTFRSRLYPAAHGVLLFAVRESIHGPRRPVKRASQPAPQRVVAPYMQQLVEATASEQEADL